MAKFMTADSGMVITFLEMLSGEFYCGHTYWPVITLERIRS